MTSTLSVYLDSISQAIRAKNYSEAASIYARLFVEYPDYLNARSGQLTASRKTHIANAANLARREGYLQWRFLESVSPRLKAALANFTGLQQYPFQFKHQQPNFFYIPDLPSQPFFEANQIPGLEEWILALKAHRDDLIALSQQATERYVEEFDNIPDTAAWHDLSQKWHSVHLVKGDRLTPSGESLKGSLKELFSDTLLAHCPPHAPEVFISVLKAGAYIPPHYGISNCKLTLHVPLEVNSQASITVGGETQSWQQNNHAIIFDDSFLHEAKNSGETCRAVLIVDIWNPHLNKQERDAIASFMQLYETWSAQFGALAKLDRHFVRP